MNFIILAAGRGTRLRPYTKLTPKCLINIGKGEVLIQRMVRIIKEIDNQANISVVLGYKWNLVKPLIKDCKVIHNPFYKDSNSIASLWFAKDLLCDDTIVMNGDVVLSKKLLEMIMKTTKNPTVFYDSTIRVSGDYNVQTLGEKVVIMSKELDHYSGEYCGVTKLDKESALKLANKISEMVEDEQYGEWYETAVVQMILDGSLELFHYDVSDFDWAEIDSVNDLLLAKEIQKNEF
jgi:choline kinase